MSGIVAHAISHLKELEENMRREGQTNFSADDVENCDSVAELLAELEAGVKTLHDELEKETIKTSVFRHKLTLFSNNVQQEIDENIKKAREANSEVMGDLKEKLAMLTASMKLLHAEDIELNKKIEKLRPETKTLSKNHESIVYNLNVKMSEKAEAQIRVNETNDTLNGVNETVAEIEDGIIVLREQIVKQKAECQRKRDLLVKEKLETLDLAREQEKLNADKSKEVEILKSNLKESEKTLGVIVRENERLDKIRAGMEEDEAKEQSQLTEEEAHLTELIRVGIEMHELEKETEVNYHKLKEETLASTEKAVEKTRVETERLKAVKEEHDLKKEEIKEVHGLLKALQQHIEESKILSNKLQQEVSEKLKEIVDLEAKSEQCYVALGEAQENHNQVMDSLMRESEEYREQLAHEKEVKLKNQHLRDSKFLEIVAFNETSAKEQNKMNKFLSETRVKHDALSGQDKAISEKIRANEIEKTRLTVELKTAQDNFKALKENAGYRITKLEREIRQYQEEDAKIVAEIEAVEPGYKQLCELNELKIKDWNKAKSDLIKAKTLKTNMDKNIKETEKKIKVHTDSLDENKFHLAFKQEERLRTLKEQSEHLSRLEHNIIQTGLRASTIKTQNAKFIQAIEQMKHEYAALDVEKASGLDTQKDLENEFERINLELVEGWQNDQDLETMFVANDKDLILKLAQILTKSQRRERDVEAISDKLYREIELQTDYLDKLMGNVARSEMFDNMSVRSSLD